MIERINNICKVEFAALHQVTDFAYLPGGNVFVDADWTELAFAKDPSFTIDENISKAGRSYESDFSVSLPAPFQNTGMLVLRITFSDGRDPMIIGSPDLPVRLTEFHRLTSKSLSFTHRSWHYPYRVAVGYTPDPEPEPEPEPVPATITWELSKWNAGPDFIDATMKIYADEVLKLAQFWDGAASIELIEGQTVRVEYSYSDTATGSPVFPFVQLLIDSSVVESEPVSIPGTDTFNYSFVIESDTQILVRAIDLGVTINWELSEWDAAPDFIDANVRIYANEVLKLEQFGNGTGSLNVNVGDTIRVQYSYLDLAEGAPVSPFIQLLIDSALIASEPVSIPGTGTFNFSFGIDTDKEILVRAIDLG